MTREQIAVEVLRCAVSHEPDVRLLGNVRASDLAALVATEVLTCPRCGCCAWVNIDCELCRLCSSLADLESEDVP